MDRKDEYHDPDYPEASTCAAVSPKKKSESENVEKIKNIIRREFSNELLERENEVMLIEQRMTTSRLMLHRLRYSLVNRYYNDQKLTLSKPQIEDEVAAQNELRSRAEVSTLLRESQRRLHPSVRKLLGRKTADLGEILLTSRVPRNTRKDYSAMLKTKVNPQEFEQQQQQQQSTPEAPKKIPRHKNPVITNVITLDEATRNQMKHRYRIIIGNTSKYAPAPSSVDRSSHVWLLYVRAAPPRDVAAVLRAVTVTLHHSYEPHHIVHLSKPPFHISRRGWGEFPAKVELHFQLPNRNRPATVEHTIKLDRNYTGLQTLGAETIVDVWLYSTPEMLKHEFKEETIDTQPEPTPDDKPDDKPDDLKPDIKVEPDDNVHTDSWLDFFSNNTTVNVDEMIIKPEKSDKNSLQTFVDTSIVKKEIINNDNDININEINDINDINDGLMEKTDWLDKVNEDLPVELLAQSSLPKKRIMKYMDPTTGKIYYLEIDRSLDVNKVQEIIISNKGNVKTAKISPIKSNGLKTFRKNVKKGVTLLKPNVLNINNDNAKRNFNDFCHLDNDHCYISHNWSNIKTEKHTGLTEKMQRKFIENEVIVKKEISDFEFLSSTIKRFSNIRRAVSFLLRNLPIITEKARDSDYVKHFPYVVENEQKYWKLDFAKRRNIEWSRVKTISKLLTENFTQNETIWRTKQILIFSRLHAFHPIRPTSIPNDTGDWSNFDRTDSKTSNTLSLFDSSKFQVTDTINLADGIDSDDEVEIVKEVTVKTERATQERAVSLTVMPVEREEDRLRYIFIEKKSADIGIELRNEDVGNGYSYSAVHAVILSAVKSFAEEIIRSSLAKKLQEERCREPLPRVWVGRASSPLRLSDVVVPDILTGDGRGAGATHTTAL